VAKQNTVQKVENYFPDAMVVFITLDFEGKPIRDLSTAHTIVPDIDDITDIQLTLGSTGKSGQFVIKINNTRNKYFYADDIVTEITNLKDGKAITYIAQQENQFSTLKTIVPSTTWESPKEYLNDKAWDRLYTPPNADDSKIYLLFQDISLKYTDAELATIVDTELRSDLSKGQIRYRSINKTSVSSYNVQKDTTSTSSSRSDGEEIVSLPIAEAAGILTRARKQSAMFEEFGGQIEHGRCMFQPMQLCVVLMRKRFQEKNSRDDMIVAFTGYVDSVSDIFSGVAHEIQIMGTDVTKVMRITQANINPSIFTKGLPEGGIFIIWQKRFAGLLGWEIIKLLTVGGDDPVGFRIRGAGYFDYIEATSPSSSAYQKVASKVDLTVGFKRTRSEELEEERDKLDDLLFSPRKVHLQILPFDSTPKSTHDFAAYKRIYGDSFSNWQNEYIDNLTIANEVALLTNYEFYADQNGDIWYHQPRFNNYHILTESNPEVYVLRDTDIINANFSESDLEVISSIYVTGQQNIIDGQPEIYKMAAFFEDPSLVRRYGRRIQPVSHPYITDSESCFYFGKSWMLRVNAGRFVGQVTILGRPELRVHMPIYIPYRNMVYYIEGISHSFRFGTAFTTTLTLKYGRKPWQILPEVLDYNVETQPNLNPYTDDRTASLQLPASTDNETKVSP
jgi:hypothetical protein